MKKAVIFDLGKVLVGYDHDKTMDAIDRHCDFDVDVVKGLFDEMIDGLSTGKIKIADMFERYQAHAGYNRTLRDFTDNFCAGLSRLEEPLAYALSLCGRDNIAVGAISNTYYGHTEWLEKHAPELSRFDVVVTSNKLGIAKPNPDIYNYALKALGVKPENAMFIDDVLQNVHGAMAVGMYSTQHTEWSLTKREIEYWLKGHE